MPTKKKRKCKLATDQQDPKRVLRSHLEALGLRSDEEYKDWCGQHGFSRTIHKSWKQLERERLVVTRQIATVRLKRAKQGRRRTRETIHEIFAGRVKAVDVSQQHLLAICRAYEATKKDRRAKLAALELLLHAEPLTDFLDTRQAIPAYGYETGNTYVEALVALATHRNSWIRPVDKWRPRTHNTRRQFASLARHLLAEFPVPTFMDSVWFKGTSKAAREQQIWFRHVGIGQNIRTAQLPIPYTKRMAHHFLKAPNDYGVEAALRWGQILAFGGDSRIANAVVATRIGHTFEHDEFWTTVVRFFVDNPMLDTAHYGPIIDYLHHQKFVAQEEFVRPGVMERRPPPQPNLSMKDRNPMTLVLQVERWHRRLAFEFNESNVDWPSTGISEFEFVEGRKESNNMKRWTIREILSGRALISEGRKMQHCVASYAGSCLRRQSSIWAMEVDGFEGRKKVLTVEVNPRSKTICQARGKQNAMPDENAKTILRRWAAQAGLQLARHI